MLESGQPKITRRRGDRVHRKVDVDARIWEIITAVAAARKTAPASVISDLVRTHLMDEGNDLEQFAALKAVAEGNEKALSAIAFLQSQDRLRGEEISNVGLIAADAKREIEDMRRENRQLHAAVSDLLGIVKAAIGTA